jgi:putative endonuclease
MTAKPFFPYILTNRPKGVLYVGVINDLVRRLSDHKGKYVPGFTKTYGVSKLVYFEEFPSVLEARARDRTLIRWQRAWKIKLVEQMNSHWIDLSEQQAV